MFVSLVKGACFDLNRLTNLSNCQESKTRTVTLQCSWWPLLFSVRRWRHNYKHIHSSTKRDILQQTDTDSKSSVQGQTGSSGSHESKTVANDYFTTSTIGITEGNTQRSAGKVVHVTFIPNFRWINSHRKLILCLLLTWLFTFQIIYI